MENDRVQAGGGDLLCYKSGVGVGEADKLDSTRLDSYPPLMMDGSPCRSGRKAKEKKKTSLISLSLLTILCVSLSLIFLLHVAGRRSVTKALKSRQRRPNHQVGISRTDRLEKKSKKVQKCTVSNSGGLEKSK